MKNFDSANVNDDQRRVSLRLTRVLPLWNHPKTVALYFATGESLPKHGAEQSNF